MVCDLARRRFFPYLDGELAGEEQASLEAHLSSCPDCQRLIHLEQTFRARYFDQLRPDPAPETVRREVSRLLNGLSDRHPGGSRERPRRPSTIREVAVVVGVFLVLGGAILGVTVRRWWSGASVSLVRLAEASVEQHQKLTRGLLPYDVRGMSPRQMERWFKGKLDFDVNLPELPRRNLALLGGRASSLAGFEVAALHYQVDGRDVSLFVMPLEKYRQLGLARAPKFKIMTYQGYDVIVWASHGVAYSLVSEIGGQSCLVCHSPGERLDFPTGLGAHGTL
jgi:anti-sigma factor RsiW